MRNNKTEIFDSFEEFKQRKDKRVNGVTKKFIDLVTEDNYDYVEDNKTNEGCWNCCFCSNCENCDSCNDCHDCIDCDDCLSCHECIDCINCNDLTRDQYIDNSEGSESSIVYENKCTGARLVESFIKESRGADLLNRTDDRYNTGYDYKQNSYAMKQIIINLNQLYDDICVVYYRIDGELFDEKLFKEHHFLNYIDSFNNTKTGYNNTGHRIKLDNTNIENTGHVLVLNDEHNGIPESIYNLFKHTLKKGYNTGNTKNKTIVLYLGNISNHIEILERLSKMADDKYISWDIEDIKKLWDKTKILLKQCEISFN